MGKRDRRRGPDRNHEFRFREPEPARQARSPPGIRVPQPGQPAQARPRRLHQGCTTALTTRNQEGDAVGNRTATRSRLTSKSHFTRRAAGRTLIESQRLRRAGPASPGGQNHCRATRSGTSGTAAGILASAMALCVFAAIRAATIETCTFRGH